MLVRFFPIAYEDIRYSPWLIPGICLGKYQVFSLGYIGSLLSLIPGILFSKLSMVNAGIIHNDALLLVNALYLYTILILY